VVSDPGGSLRLSGFMENPVLNISGKKIISVPAGAPEIRLSSLDRLSVLFSQIISDCKRVSFISGRCFQPVSSNVTGKTIGMGVTY